MKKLLLETSFSKIYMIVMILITLLVVGGYFSYAMFTVSKEKSNAISIVTGNLAYKLEVDGEETNTLVVPSYTFKEFIITLSNTNNRVARFNFYYEGSLPTGVKVGYVESEGYNITPISTGVNLEKADTSGSSNIYKIVVNNLSSDEIRINLGVEVGLDYNDLELPSNGHLFNKYEKTLADVLFVDSTNSIDTTDDEQLFITGEDPNNYIWYSGKLWRAVSIDPSDNSVKLATEWDISAITFGYDSTAFEESNVKEWLNDESVDGFLYNLREPEKFIKMDSEWNATMMTTTDKPPKTTMVTSPVGLLNIYEYTMSYSGTTASNGYLNNGLYWWTLTPYNEEFLYRVSYDGSTGNYSYFNNLGFRPAINLKPGIMTVDGSGTEDDPYRLEGDNDNNLNGTLLNTRYSGEYISFGTGENNLYRIVSHEINGLTKITNEEPLKNDGSFVTVDFGDNNVFSSNNTIGSFLNNDYLNPSNGYLTNDQVNMIEDNTTWYLGRIESGNSYKLAKYIDTNMSGYVSSINAKVGLLRYGELMSGQFERYALRGESTNSGLTRYYWLLTLGSGSELIYRVSANGASGPGYTINRGPLGIKVSLNLKSDVIITGGNGTKNDPFELS